MKKIHVQASREYDVVIENGLLAKAGSYIGALKGKAEKAVIISDDIVFGLYGEALKQALADTGLSLCEFVFLHGERSKNLATYGEILEYMNAQHFTRSDLVLALGGGVVGDMAGFAAATYQRGIRFVQIPTTLLADVDSSVGGKTAVDLKNSKNQVGCFYQPSLVLCDPETLATLPEEEFKCGSAEVIKYAILGNADFYTDLMDTDIKEQLEHVIATCVTMKRDIVQNDEFDTGQRMLLNFGHTFGHAAEACSDFGILHGQAVAMGMGTITRGAYAQGKCSKETVDAVEQILTRYALPDQIPYTKDAIMAEVLTDKKLAGKTMRIVLPEAVGRCVVEELSVEELAQYLQ